MISYDIDHTPLNPWQVAPSVWRPTSEMIFGQTVHIFGLKKKNLFRIVEKMNNFCFVINFLELLKKIFI